MNHGSAFVDARQRNQAKADSTEKGHKERVRTKHRPRIVGYPPRPNRKTKVVDAEKLNRTFPGGKEARFGV
jgi:hypothetical protein